MTTSVSQSTGIDTGSLEELLEESGQGESGVRPRVIPGLTAVAAPAETVDLSSANGNGRAADSLAGVVTAATLHPIDSTPEDSAVALHLKRSLRTAGPLLAADLAALALAGLLGQLLTSMFSHGAFPLPGYASAFALLPLVLGFWMVGLYSEVWVHPALELRQIAQITTVALLAVALAGGAPAMALWCAVAWLAAVPLVSLARAVARRCCASRAWWGFPTLVIGSGEGGDRLARMLMRSRSCGLRPALLTDPDATCRASIVPVMNDPAVLRSMVRSRGIRHAVLCIADLPAAKLAKALDQYGALASHLLVVTDAPPLPALWGAQRVCGLGGVELRNGLLLAPLRLAKRVMDVAIACVALVLGFPLLAAIALLVKLSGPGPILYGHRRIGRHGRKFTAWKFRTMHRGADVLLRQHFDRFPGARLEWERDQKLRDDPRVTKVGHYLRQLSLDELPQLWNVLRGEMSVVGPRPIVDDEVARYGESFGMYAAVKPGVTGLWQVSGRTDVGYDMRVKLDEFYVRHWTPWLDAYVLVRTVAALLCRRGAY